MKRDNLKKALIDFDEQKKTVAITYRMDSGKLVSITTIIRVLVEKNEQFFILTESGEPISIDAIIGVKEKM